MKIHCLALTANLRILDFLRYKDNCGVLLFIYCVCEVLKALHLEDANKKELLQTKLHDCGDARLLKLWVVLGKVWVSVKND